MCRKKTILGILYTDFFPIVSGHFLIRTQNKIKEWSSTVTHPSPLYIRYHTIMIYNMISYNHYRQFDISYHTMLYHITLCCIISHYDISYYIMLYHITLCCIISHYDISYYIMLYHITLWYIILHYYTISHYIMQYWTTLYSISFDEPISEHSPHHQDLKVE